MIKINIKYFEEIIKDEPKNKQHKYIFLIDNRTIALFITASGYHAVSIEEESEGFYSLESFLAYLDKIAFTGKCPSYYTFVSACSTKKANDRIEAYCKQECLSYRSGWMLFREKEYLEKFENQEELKSILQNFIGRFEKSSANGINLDQFHKFNESGKRIGILDMEIVDYLIKSVPFFIIGGIPFVNEKGVYFEDKGGIQLKSRIQGLLYRD